MNAMKVNGLDVIYQDGEWHIITPSGHDVFHMKTKEGAVRIAKNFTYRTSPLAVRRINMAATWTFNKDNIQPPEISG
jgi:hypothetical protein